MQHKTAKKVNITFQGLKQYTEISQLMEYDLKEFKLDDDFNLLS